jgi:hypothetical protein
MEPNEKRETSSILSLEVSQEQKDAIYHFFAHNDWEFKEVQIRIPLMLYLIICFPPKLSISLICNAWSTETIDIHQNCHPAQ